MKWTGLNEIRESFLAFFESKEHLRLKSFSLVPHNDNSLLLINSGMAPMKPYFKGTVVPPSKRVTTCQKCIRTPDLDNVGKTARHGTFFEMLGNFSFGDYFKHEAIAWAWEYLTKVLEIPSELLWPSIYENDDEAFEIWTKEVGVPPEKVIRLGKSDNFWEHGSGPCGPCSEIYFDRGEKYGCGSPDCRPGCDCDRYMEIWNNVFSQFDNDGHGNYTELIQKNIDTGMGLERLACVMQGVDNLFEVDTVRSILDTVCEYSGKSYGADKDSDISIRIITDHIRSSTFMIADGIMPSNEGRGYVLRRLIRRAARHGRLIGIKGAFLNKLCEKVIENSGKSYPELSEKRDYIKKILSIEEEKFDATIDSGLAILSDMCENMAKKGEKILSGECAFKLYDTFGFPVDLTREIVGDKGFTVDEEAFTLLMKEQKERARANRKAGGGWDAENAKVLTDVKKTEFLGYTSNLCEAKVLKILVDNAEVGEVSEGSALIVLDKTVFYGESGGQVGDTGIMTGNVANIKVVDTQKKDGIYIHECEIDGRVAVGETLKLEIDVERRNAIRRNHSACHLLQASLRAVLGTHVEQAGSYVDPTRLRFDFKHFSPMTKEEIEKVEATVNGFILSANPVTTIETDPESAKKMGAMALFGEKYGAVVRMVKMGDVSTELCGGTHLNNTAEAGLFKIISESSVASGIRRIEGTTGLGVLELLSEKQEVIDACVKASKASGEKALAGRIGQLTEELKAKEHELEKLLAKSAAEAGATLEKDIVKTDKFSLLFGKIEGASADVLRCEGDRLREKYPDIAGVLYTVLGEKIVFAGFCGKDAVKNGGHAGNILKAISPIVGGGGGGRPDSASSGGRDITKIEEAKAAFFDMMK